MSRVLPNLIGDYAIIQGEDWNYQKHTAIAFPYGDWTLWMPRGQIRTNIKGATNELLATFTWGDPEWDEANNRTLFYPLLTSAITELLLPTKYQGIGDLSTRNAYVYDIEIELSGVIQKGSRAYVQVIGEVTYAD
jgi:hypothetical protein